MELSLTKIIEQPGASVPFETALDLRDLDFGSCCPVSEPLRVRGQVKNKVGVLLLTGEMETTLHCVCDRCCRSFTRPYVGALDAVLTAELANEEDEDERLFALQGDSVELDEVVRTQFVLSMDSKLLCSPDCKGLCPRCGANLNDGPCGCKKETDPRLAALAQLLKD